MLTRHPRAVGFWILGAAAVLAAPAGAQPAADAAAEKHEIAVVGASLSAGFICPWTDEPGDEPNRTVKLRKALGAVWPTELVRFRDRSDLMTFLDPVGKQTPRVDRVVADEPALVIAIDFLFWFGYGHVSGPDEEAARLELLEKGLALLDRLGCPIVVGDFPDMHGADPRMLSARQIPRVETLEKLNARVGQWAGDKENVILFPLAEWAAEMKAVGREVDVDGEKIELGPDALLQSDDLHPTRLGIAVVARGIAEVVRGRFAEGHALRPAVPVFVDVVSRIGAAQDLEAVLEAAGK